MSSFVSPLCLLLALCLLIAGFGVWAVEPPEAGVELHQARALGDEQYEQALEAQLVRRQLARRLLTAGLFAGSAFMTVLAFTLMRETR